MTNALNALCEAHRSTALCEVHRSSAQTALREARLVHRLHYVKHTGLVHRLHYVELS